MDFLQQAFSVRFEYKVFFTNRLFDTSNQLFRTFLKESHRTGITQKILFVADEGVVKNHPTLLSNISDYFSGIDFVRLVDPVLVVPGGEVSKNSEDVFRLIVEAVNRYGIDRHSYIVGLGGGSLLDVAGYAAAISHRGIRHIRIPTTVLSQNDSGVGVKNGINYFGKKNFVGTFAPPVAVFNDFHFLTTLEDADWRSGTSEAVKVALIKDLPFFEWLEAHAEKLRNRDMNAMQYLIRRCAELHLQHIAGKDPFETGSSRPLDFGHWSAHKLEQLTEFKIRHGHAVAIGIALDSAYSHVTGRITENELMRILNLIDKLGLPARHPSLEMTADNSPLLKGLNEFREHLGGQLTIMLLSALGKGEEVHEMDPAKIREASELLGKISFQHS